MKAKEFFKIHKAATILSCVGFGALVLSATPIIVNEVLRDKTDYANEYHIPIDLTVVTTEYKTIIDPDTKLPMDVRVPLVAPNTNDACWNCLTTQRYLDKEWYLNVSYIGEATYFRVVPDWNIDWSIWNHNMVIHFVDQTPPISFELTFSVTIHWHLTLPDKQTSVLPPTTFKFD